MAVNDWAALLMDARPIAALFGRSSPPLTAVVLHEVTLHRDGPRVVLRFDLADFPADPPPKWTLAGFNQLQLRLVAAGVQSLELSGWSSDLTVNLDVTREGNLVRVRANGPAFKLVFDAGFLAVDSITPYRMEEPA